MFPTKNIFSSVLLSGILLCTAANSTRADIVTVLFTGFFTQVPGSGMEALNMHLRDRFDSTMPSVIYSGRAFEYDERELALEFINSIDQVDKLYLIGHSFGGSSALQLAENFLAPTNVRVDLTFQIDSVDNPLGGPPDNILPSNVDAGFNYYQRSTGIIEPQGEMFVEGAQNFNVEVLFDDTTITHTSIDNDIRLHERIFNDITLELVPEPKSVPFLLAGFSTLLLARHRRDRIANQL